MNRLKFVLGINVPRRTPSSTVILAENRSKETCKKQHSEVQLGPMLKPNRLFSTRAKKFNDFRSFHSAGLARNGVSSKRTPLERNFPVEFNQKRRNATYQAKRVPNGRRSSVQNNQRVTEIAKESKNPKHQQNEATSLLEKEPRTYAQMIANYSETIYAQTSSGILKDSLSTAMLNGIHRSPFSTASAVSQKWRNRAKGVRSECLRVTEPNSFNQSAKFSSNSSTVPYERQNDKRSSVNRENKNELERTSSSYASIIEKYSNAFNLEIDCHGWCSNLIPKRNVSTNLDDFSMMLMDAKSAAGKSMEMMSRNKSDNVADSLAEANAKDEAAQDQTDWMMKVEDIIKDLKRITATKEGSDPKSNEKWILQSVNERADWLDRVVNAHKKRIRERNPTSEKTLLQGSTNVNVQSKDSNSTTQDARFAGSNESSGSTTRQPRMMSGDKSNPISDYIRRGPSSSGSTTKSTSQPPTVATGSAKEPQIELRMTPSQNESVVSINVDESAAKTAGTSAKEQLSVVISSKRKKVSNVETSNANLQSDFGSMQISISEDTVPVKQIEFSINGKPVSELKSIVARADKLDVVSSMDKVEIRIPSKENASSVSSEQTKNLIKTATTSKPVLNLQIAAKFNEPRVQQPRDTGLKTDTTPPSMTTPSTPTPTPKPTPSQTPTQTPPAKPPRTQNLFSTKLTSEASKELRHADVANATIVKPEEIATIKQIDTAANAEASIVKQQSTPKVAENVPSTVKPDDGNVTVPPANPPQRPTMNTENPATRNPDEQRTPSNIIPWWSSEDSFRKIKKKGNTPRSASAFDDALSATVVEENIGVMRKSEQILKSDVESSNAVNATITETSAKDLAARKAALEENKNSPDVSDSTFRVVRVRSPPKWVPIKPSSPRTSRQRAASGAGRVTRKLRYRVKSSPGMKGSAAGKEDPDKSTVSAARPPKVIRYVSVDPQKISMNEKPEAKASTANIAKTIAEERQKTASKIEIGKVEASKGEAKSRKLAEAGGTETTNVQHSNTVFKAARDLEKPANRSADVSAKSATSGREFSVEQSEGNRGEDKAERRAETNLPSRRELAEEQSDQRIKQILKSMKPIEKKKDGTLIDYGVIVPSRKPSTQLRQVPRIRSNTPSKVDLKEHPSRNENIVEPEKVSSTRKRTLTEPENVTDQGKIVEPEKILSVKKLNEIKNVEVKYETKLNKFEWKTQLKEEIKGNVAKKEHRSDRKTVSSINSDKDNLQTSKHATSAVVESKKNSPVANLPNKDQSLEATNRETIGKASINEKLPNQSSKSSLAARNVSSEDVKSSPMQSSEKEIPKSSLNPGIQEGTSLEKSLSERSTKPPGKTCDINIVDFSKPTSRNKSKNVPSKDTVTSADLQSSEKETSKSNLKREARENAPSEASLPVLSFKSSVKTNDITYIDFSKTTSFNEPKGMSLEDTITPPRFHVSSEMKRSKIQLEPGIQEKTSSGSYFQCSKNPVRTNDITYIDFSKTTSRNEPKDLPFEDTVTPPRFYPSPEVERSNSNLKPAIQKNTSSERYFRHSKNPAKTNDITYIDFSKTTSFDEPNNVSSEDTITSSRFNASPEMKRSKNKLEPVIQEKTSSERSFQSFKAPVKTNDITYIDFSKTTSFNEPTSVPSEDTITPSRLHASSEIESSPGIQKNTSLRRYSRSSKNPVKTNDITYIDFSKTTSLNEPKSVSSEDAVTPSRFHASPEIERSKNQLKPGIQEKTSSKRSFRSSKNPVKNNDITYIDFSKTTSFNEPNSVSSEDNVTPSRFNVSPEIEISKNKLKSGIQEKTSSERSFQSFKAPVKTNDITYIDFSKTTSFNEPNSVSSEDNVTPSRFNASPEMEISKNKLKSGIQEKTSSERSFQSFKAPVKTNDITYIDFSKTTSFNEPNSVSSEDNVTPSRFNASPEMEIPKNKLKSGIQEQTSSERSFRSSKPPVKTNDITYINFSKTTSLNEPKDVPSEDTVTPSRLHVSPEIEGPKGNLKAGIEEETPLEGTIVQPAGSVDKATSDPLPLMGTIAFPSPEKSDKVTKSDNSHLEESTVQLGKKASTEPAPFEGTINYKPPPKRQDNLKGFANISEKKPPLDTFKQKKNDLSTKKNASRTLSTPKDPADALTGPAGLTSSKSISTAEMPSRDDNTPTGCLKEGTSGQTVGEIENNATSFPPEQDSKSYVFFSNERPEKDMLYSSWLQRFKDKLDDDKAM